MSDEEHEGGHERWLVSYADFMTLLFAFFVVLYATSEKNAAKTEEFQESVKRYLIKGGGGAQGGGAPQLNQGQINNSILEPALKTYPNQRGESIEANEKTETFVEGLSAEERRTYVADLSQDDWGVRIVLPSGALFAPNDDHFRADAIKFLNKLALVLSRSQRKILIEGHVAAGELGRTHSTWDFASARAINLLRFVQKTQNLARSRLVTASLGDSRPRAKGDAAANSRVEVVLLNADMEL